MANTQGLPPFAISQLEQAVILTALIPDLTVNNASWFKDHLLEFVHNYKPELLVINLVNIRSVDRIGVGIMISLNSELKNKLALSFAYLQPEVDEHLKNMYLRHAFKVVDPGWPCLICHQENCQHLSDWDECLQQFIFTDDQPLENIPSLSDLPGYQPKFEGLPQEESSLEEIVAAFENDPRYQALETLRENKFFWQKVRHFTIIGSMSTAFVLGTILLVVLGVNSDWVALLNQAKSSMQRPNYDYNKDRVLEYHEIIDRFDKNGDGIFSKEDWIYLESSEKLELINHGFQDRIEKNRSPFQALTK